MKNFIRNFSFPYKTVVLILSTFILFIPLIFIGLLGPDKIIALSERILKLLFLIPTFIAMLGFTYCTLGYHFQILRGDELKLRIHFESLNISFTSMLVSFFVLIFIFINFAPVMLNWILVFLTIIGIVSYLLAVQFVKEKYQ